MATPLSNAPLSPARLSQAAGDFAADTRSLDALKREASRDPHAAAKKAATQFEALFMQMVLKSMREATPKGGLLGNDSAHDTYSAMLDQQLATSMSGRGGNGSLADVLTRQLTRHLTRNADAGAGARPIEGTPAEGTPAKGTPAKGTPAKGTPARTDTTSNANAPGGTDAAARADKYGQLLRRNVNAVSRYEALQPTVESQRARAEYLSRSAPLVATAPTIDHASSTSDHRSPVSDPQRNFVLRHWDHATAAERATGVPAKFIVGQAALESGWGRHEIKRADGLPSHNLFGIKAGSTWKGATVDVVTTEYENGEPKKVVEKFRAYTSYADAFRDWALLLSNNPRYGKVLQQKSQASYAFEMQRSGYATDPAYGEKLARTVDAVVRVRKT